MNCEIVEICVALGTAKEHCSLNECLVCMTVSERMWWDAKGVDILNRGDRERGLLLLNSGYK